jgi:hypothetical protein
MIPLKKTRFFRQLEYMPPPPNLPSPGGWAYRRCLATENIKKITIKGGHDNLKDKRKSRIGVKCIQRQKYKPKQRQMGSHTEKLEEGHICENEAPAGRDFAPYRFLYWPMGEITKFQFQLYCI